MRPGFAVRMAGLAAAILWPSLAMLAGAQSPAAAKPSYRDIDYTLLGTVTEKWTGKPMVGAPVVVIYRRPGDDADPRSGGRGKDAACRKVKGTLTDAEGRFRLPAERLDDLVATRILAIHPDHYTTEKFVPATSSPRHGGSREVTMNIELRVREAPGAMITDSDNRHSHDYAYQKLSQYTLDCWRASVREDAEPVLPFLEVLKGEFLKYDLANEGRNARGTARDIDRIAHLLRSIPPRAEASK